MARVNPRAMKPSDRAAQWERRLAAVGAAQSRYLWVLAVLGLFYFSVNQVLFAATPTIPSTFRAPILGVDISATAVWASGPGVLCLLLLVILGCVRAAGVASGALGLPDLGSDAEAYDTSPNAIDLAAYSTTETAQWVRWILGFAYPVFLTAFFAEAVWFLVLLWLIGHLDALWAYVVAVPTTVLVGWAGVRLLAFWRTRAKPRGRESDPASA